MVASAPAYGIITAPVIMEPNVDSCITVHANSNSTVVLV